MAGYVNDSAGVWMTWNGYAISTATSPATSSDTWTAWTSGTYSTTATSTNTVWKILSGTGTYAASGSQPSYLPVPRRELTEEEKAKQAEEQALYQEQVRKRAEKERRRLEEENAKLLAANKRAEELLVRFLDKEQLAQYERDKAFEVVASDGERYRVRNGWAGHVDRLKDGKPVERFCIHPNVQVPHADNQLLAKLMLDGDLERFKRTANRTQLAPATCG
jgi:hypothetical protein